MSPTRFGVGIVCLFLVLGLAAPAGSEAGWSYDLADELMSPYCPGRALSECPSPQAEQLRSWILDQERQGTSRADVEGRLFARFGDTLRQTPRTDGVGVVAYLIPALVFLVGGTWIFFFLRRQAAQRAAAEPAEPASPVDPALEREIEEELRRELDRTGSDP